MSVEKVERFKNIAIVSWATIGIFVLLYGTIKVIGAVGVVIRPVVFALVIVFLITPVLNYLEKKGLPRVVALVLTYLFFIALLTGIMLFVAPIVVSEVNQLANTMPKYSQLIDSALTEYQTNYDAFKLSPQANRMIDSVLESVQSSVISILSGIPGYTISVLSLLLDFILAPLIAFFILVDRSRLANGMAALVPKAIRPQTMYLVYRLTTAVEGVLRVMLVLALFIALLCSFGLFVAGVPFALLLGFFAGFVQVVPYVGPIAGVVPIVIVAWIAKSGWYALGIGIYFMLLTQITSLILYPIMMREHVGVHPLLVIIAMLLGGALFDVWGVLAALPAAAIINEIGSFLLLPKEEQQRLVKEYGG